MFLASPVKRDKNYEIRLLWYFSILYIRHINDQLFLFLSYFFVCFPTLSLLFLKLQSYFYPTFLHMPARKPGYMKNSNNKFYLALFVCQHHHIPYFSLLFPLTNRQKVVCSAVLKQSIFFDSVSTFLSNLGIDSIEYLVSVSANH